MKQSRSLRAVLAATAMAGVLMVAAGPASATPDRTTPQQAPATAECKPGQSCGGCKNDGWTSSVWVCVNRLIAECTRNQGVPTVAVGPGGTYGIECD